MNGASHSTAAGPPLNGSANAPVFITHYCLVPFSHGQNRLPSQREGVRHQADLLKRLILSIIFFTQFLVSQDNVSAVTFRFNTLILETDFSFDISSIF